MDTTVLLIDSNNRDLASANSNDFKYTLNGYGMLDVNSFRVNKVCIPYSFYSIPEQQIQLDDNGTPRTITITAGNYTATELGAAFQAAITAAGGVGTDYVFNYSDINLTFTITRAAGTFSFDFATTAGFSGSFDDYRNVGVLMGLIGTRGTTGTATATVASFTGPFTATLSGITNIKIECKELSKSYTSIDQKNKSYIIETIPITANRGEYINWEAKTIKRFLIRDKFVETFRFRLLDNNNNSLDLNGKDWTMEIEFELL